MSATDAATTPAVDATDTDASSTVFFPPRDFIDFVIHYSGTDFHVHRLVLHYHSAYFRTYFQTLSASSSTASANGSPSPSCTPPCNHPSIAHCILLPLQTRVVEQTPVTAADFRLFLCHLYFGSHYRYPPFLPKTDIDLTADSTALLFFGFPAVPSLDWSPASLEPRSTDSECKQLVCNEAVLTLAHYLDCAQLLKQCDDVLSTKEGWAEPQKVVAVAATRYTSAIMTHGSWMIDECLKGVELADRYRLKNWRAICVSVIAAAANQALLANEEYKREKLKWDKALVLNILEAAMPRLL